MTTPLRTFTAAALIAAGALAAAPAHAGRVIWSVGIGVPGVTISAGDGYGWNAGYYAPAPVYYAPPPVYYAPPLVVPYWHLRSPRRHMVPPPRYRHMAPPPRYRHIAPPIGRHPGALPAYHHGGHMRPPHGRR